MRKSILVHRYAKAFLELAIRNNMVEKALDDLKTVTKTLKENRELRSLLAQPFISKSHKINILKEVFKKYVSPKTLDLLYLMINKNRENYIIDIYDQYYEMYLEYKNIAVVTITSAIKLDDRTKQRIINILRYKINDSIQIENKIDKNIIGGFILNYKDYRYDASIIYTIKQLHKMFEQNLFVKGY